MNIQHNIRNAFACSLVFLTLFFASQHGHADILPIQEGEAEILLSIHGSNTVGARLVPAWATSYLETLGLENIETLPLARTNESYVQGRINGQRYAIHIAAHGSSTGFKALLSQEAHIAMSSRKIKDQEVDALKQFGDMRSFSAENVVAIDGLAVIVNKENPVETLTISQIADIYTGKISNWQQLGGANLEIQRYARDSNSGTWDTFNGLVLKKAPLAAETQRFESNDVLSRLVSNDKSGIGFVGLASVRESKAIAIADGSTIAQRPEKLVVAAEDYPLARRLYLYLPPKTANPRARDFIEFTHEYSNQKLVDTIGFVSLNPIISLATLSGNEPRAYKHIANNAQRLSINFRFESGSFALDNRALRDVERLAEFKQREENNQRYILLVGFGDPKKSNDRAVLLSKLRASSVQMALFKNGVSTLPVTGFGSDIPIASESGVNRLKNQRVEVWILDQDKREAFDEQFRKIYKPTEFFNVRI